MGDGLVGDGRVRSAQPEPDTSYVESLLPLVRNSRLASVGNTADSSGNRKPPRWTMSFVTADLFKRLSASVRRLDLYFFNLRFLTFS